MSYSGECEVFNGTTLVGTLTRLPGHGNPTVFQYDPDYQGPALSLSLPKSGKSFASSGLHPFFSNLISEGWLENAQQRLIHNGTAPSRFEMLAYFGGDCIGSLRIIPKTPLPWVSVQNINDLSAELANNSHALIPGVEPKVLARRGADGKYHVSDKNNASTHIAKLDPSNIELNGILETEFITTLLVQAFLPDDKTSEVDLTSVFLSDRSSDNPTIELKPALLIKRFDRTNDGEPIEMYEFNQLLGKKTEEKYDGAYKDMADFIRAHATANPQDGIQTNIDDVNILFKRVLVSILAGNVDTHLKNFALIREGEEFRLSPNYDLVSCARYKKYNGLALRIGANTRIFRVSDTKPRDIIQLATDFGVLSEEPTMEEAQNLKKLLAEIGGRRALIHAEVMGSEPGELQQVAQIKDHSTLKIAKIRTGSGQSKSLAEVIVGEIETRWNGTFVGVDKVLEIKMAARNKTAAQQKKPPRPASALPGASAAPFPVSDSLA